MTRAQAVADLKKARAEGADVAPLDFPVAFKTDVASTRSREDVRAEARAFVKSGQPVSNITSGY